MKKNLSIALAAAFCSLLPAVANATQVLITVSEVGLSGKSLVVGSWVQDQNPVPLGYRRNFYTTVAVVSTVGLGRDDAVTWYSSANGQMGGFTNYNENFNILAPVSYANGEATPTFLPGLYSGVAIKPDFTYLKASYTITALLSRPARFAALRFHPDFQAPAVPEPASWAMMLVGFGVIGAGSRWPRRRPALLPAPVTNSYS